MQIAKIYSCPNMFPYYLKLMLAKTKSQPCILSKILYYKKGGEENKQKKASKEKGRKEGRKEGDGGRMGRRKSG